MNEIAKAALYRSKLIKYSCFVGLLLLNGIFLLTLPKSFFELPLFSISSFFVLITLFWIALSNFSGLRQTIKLGDLGLGVFHFILQTLISFVFAVTVLSTIFNTVMSIESFFAALVSGWIINVSLLAIFKVSNATTFATKVTQYLRKIEKPSWFERQMNVLNQASENHSQIETSQEGVDHNNLPNPKPSNTLNITQIFKQKNAETVSSDNLRFINTGKGVSNTQTSTTVVKRKRPPLQKVGNRIVKRLFDIIFSLAVILLVFPWLFPIIAILIRRESRGPIFFIQKRSGVKGRAFRCMKFRSMTVNNDSDTKQATKNDSRITKIGSFLRKSNLDELPQFFNVLMGHMSIVGPRPHMLKHTEDYSMQIDNFMERHEVKPGITGWAQVNGWRGPTDLIYKMEKRVEYDIQYIENWSLWLDVKILIMTAFNMTVGEENAF